MKETMTKFHATINETTKHYEMTQNWFNKLIENLPEGYDWKKSPKKDNMYAITKGKERVAIIDIVKRAAGSTKTETKKPETKKANVSRETSSGIAHKERGKGYIVLYKKTGDKKETRNTEMTTCAEIKAFLKTISKKQLEYLKIYDENNKECRKSAWVG